MKIDEKVEKIEKKESISSNNERGREEKTPP